MLKNRCALITGSTGGLSFALVSKLAVNGAILSCMAYVTQRKAASRHGRSRR